jgi:hypothetical protein
MAANGAEVAMISRSELGVSRATVRWALECEPNCSTMSLMKRSRSE